MQICKSNFKEEEIGSAKVLLYQLLGKVHRMPTRRRDKKGEESLQDIISLFKEADPDDVPTFVAKLLLPPVTFDHVDSLAEVQCRLDAFETISSRSTRFLYFFF